MRLRVRQLVLAAMALAALAGAASCDMPAPTPFPGECDCLPRPAYCDEAGIDLHPDCPDGGAGPDAGRSDAS